MEILRDRLKECRLERGLTQAQLAHKAYSSKNIISHLERGVTKNVKPEEIKLLSSALLVTEDYLTGASDDSSKNKDGLKPLLYTLPKWNWKEDIEKVLKKHSRVREIETILRDCVYLLWQLNIENPNYYQNPNIRALKKTIELLNIEDFSDAGLLNDFLDILSKRNNIKER